MSTWNRIVELRFIYIIFIVVASIQDKINACDYVVNNLLNEQERIVLKNEAKIIRLNTSQFENGKGSDDKKLVNDNSRYSGRYTYFTQQVALFEHPIASKIEGELYNFAWNGDFLRGMQIKLFDSDKLDIFSTGTGSGSKAKFFSGYDNLFGLDTESMRILQYEIIKPELLIWIKKYL